MASMHTPNPTGRRPLHDLVSDMALASQQAQHFAIQELAFTTQINLRGDGNDPQFQRAIEQSIGCTLPQTANTFSKHASYAVLWLGPDEWLITAPVGEHSTLERTLRTALQGIHHSVVDVSANRTIIELSGDWVRLILAKGCSHDFSAHAFFAPQVRQTQLAKAQVILQCIETATVFRVYVRHSFAQYLTQWLIDAATEAHAAVAIDTVQRARRLA